MRRPVKVGLTVLVFLALGVSLPGEADRDHHDGHKMGNVDNLTWSPIGSLPGGAEMAIITGNPSEKGPFTMRIRMPADYRIPPHWHPAIENVTVIRGRFHMGTGEVFDRDSGSELNQGGYAVIDPKVRHYAWTRDERTIIQLHGQGPWKIHYVNEEDDPRNVP